MREITNAFFLYAGENRGRFPVVKYDLRGPNGEDAFDNPRYAIRLSNGTTISRLYWFDFVGKYVSKGQFGQGGFAGTKGQLINADSLRRSVIWGCPNWQGTRAANAEWNGAQNTDGKAISVFENGYTMNPYYSYEVNNPARLTDAPKSTEIAMASAEQGFDGKFPNQTDYTKPSQRALLVESTLWFFGFGPVSSPAQIQNQQIARNWYKELGESNFDRYRHGVYPPVISGGFDNLGQYDRNKGRVGLNIAYADGHVATITDYADAYAAIRMRKP
jgi:prepilin-type processing-associated H-X9-DG protein